ncbi:hypothetical protein [Streptomyces sp. NPDC048057]|uniref:hypothetical protein n=1 Tax=Streptomyces sp. NPDC048057 TaxID=3155628 RepID=UPI00340A3FEE
MGEDGAQRESVQTQLNQNAPLDGGGGGGPSGDLASSPAKKRAAANAIEHRLEPGTKKAGSIPEENTTAAVTAFKGDGQGWATSGALQKALQTWQDQVRALLGRLSAEKSGLRDAAGTLQGSDAGAGDRIRGSSRFDAY